MKIDIEIILTILFFLTGSGIMFCLYRKEKNKRAGEFSSYPGDDSAILAVNSQGEEVKVDLPSGVKPEDVKAVYVGKKPEKAKVVILHAKENRRNVNVNTNISNGMGLRSSDK